MRGFDIVAACPPRVITDPSREQYVGAAAARDTPGVGSRVFDEVLLVGELNPYGSSPEYALYPDPPNSAGARLCQYIGAGRDTYTSLWRTNLCRGKWSLTYARERARFLLGLHRWNKFVLLGVKVQQAFARHIFLEQTIADARHMKVTQARHRCGESVETLHQEVVIFRSPHPSGLNLQWNNPETSSSFSLLFRSHILQDHP